MLTNKKTSITIEFPDQSIPETDSWLLLPRPYNDWNQGYLGAELTGVSAVKEIQALNSQQHAYLLKPNHKGCPKIQFDFEGSSQNQAPEDCFWQLESNRYTEPSQELSNQARSLTEECRDEGEIISKLIREAAKRFDYEHPDERFNTGYDEVPLVCGTTKGSCIDINTYLIASSRALGISVQYVAGYWFHPERSHTLDMHCWLVFNVEGKPVYWDLAHHLKWGVETLSPGLNPAGGRRIAMSCGRGLRFQTPYGDFTISHFSEPVWLSANKEPQKPNLMIKIHEASAEM